VLPIIETARSKLLTILQFIIESMEKVNEIIALLKKEYPDVKIALDFSNPLELLIATILSAQSTDKQINKVTKKLFEKYRTPQDYVKTPQEELEKDIYSSGFYKNKAKNIKKLCEILVENFNSKVPDTMEDLIMLPGVARKTANIVLSGAFGKIEGIAVDTHVKRVSFRLGLTANTDPEKIENDLMKIIPKNDWDIFALLLIQHGRQVCEAKKPKCEICVLNKLCPSAFTFG
jgi:endonuclease-3